MKSSSGVRFQLESRKRLLEQEKERGDDPRVAFEFKGAVEALRWVLGFAVPDSTWMNCSYCGKSAREVKKLSAAATGAHICDECIGLCNDILAGKDWKEPKP